MSDYDFPLRSRRFPGCLASTDASDAPYAQATTWPLFACGNKVTLPCRVALSGLAVIGTLCDVSRAHEPGQCTGARTDPKSDAPIIGNNISTSLFLASPGIKSENVSKLLEKEVFAKDNERQS